MRRHRQAKIVATLGPSSNTFDKIKKLFTAGVDVFRLNFSHGTYQEHKQYYDFIRLLEKEVQRPIGILLDLQGPKFRIGKFSSSFIHLYKGDIFSFDKDLSEGNEHRVCLLHPELYEVLKTGNHLLLDDGKIRLQVLSCEKESIKCKVIMGGKLSHFKGLNIPGIKLPIPFLTEKDKADLHFGLNLGIDWIALSFVQTPEDVKMAKSLVREKAKIVSKLEKPSAIAHLDDIIHLSDAILIARGDLGVEMPPEDIPSIQRRIIRNCRKAGKPVIVATQMLDSMVHNPFPTRAEASDVATAIYDGVDAVMLSAESASGDYPIESVSIMDRIIKRVEQDPTYRQMLDTNRSKADHTTAGAITAAAREVAQTIKVSAIVTFSDSGATTLRAARERPESPILALSPNLLTVRMLSLVWGAHAVVVGGLESFAQMTEIGCQVCKKEGFSKKGDKIIVTAGVPFGISGATNILRVAEIEQ
ncbi:MAG: pyruvate kinase [Proteobacteria bacterium]|nr:pyruvate kinase [Pseudomonadota bacterium]